MPQTLPRGERRGKGMRSRGWCGPQPERRGHGPLERRERGGSPFQCGPLGAPSNRCADLMIRSCAELIGAEPDQLGPTHTGGNVPPLAGVFASWVVLSISPGRRAACEHRPRRLPGGSVGIRRHGSTWPVMAVRRQLRGLLHALVPVCS